MSNSYMARKRKQCAKSASSSSDTSFNTPPPSSSSKKCKASGDTQQTEDELSVNFPLSQNSAELDSKEGENVNSVSHSMGDKDKAFSLGVEQGATNDDIMLKLCGVSKTLEKVMETVEELKSVIFTLQTENDTLKTEVKGLRDREDQLEDKISEVKCTAELADRRSEELSAYIRRNNLRIFGVSEDRQGREETAADCENKVLSLFKEKLKIKVDPRDIEAVHRVGGPKKGASDAAKRPRGIIVRFVSRRMRDEVLYARRNLRGTKVLMVEDLTPRAYALLCVTKDNKRVCDRAWTKNGKVFMKTLTGKIVQVDSTADLSKCVTECEETVASPKPSTSGKR